MKKAQLVFIPSPGAGHLVSTVEIAKLLLQRVQHLYITVLIMKLPFDDKISSYIENFSLTSSNNPNSERINFINLPDGQPKSKASLSSFLNSLVESKKPYVKEIVQNLTSGNLDSDDQPQLAGFVIDMFCTTMIDVANELGVPSYIFFTSNAAYLNVFFYLQTQHDEHKKDITEFKDSDTELHIPGFHNLVPCKVLPGTAEPQQFVNMFVGLTRRFRETKGIMVNTFRELESSVVEILESNCGVNNPPIYPVGPILNIKGDVVKLDSQGCDILKWLDNQPAKSVLLLCFGSMGSFDEAQNKEIAIALERSGVSFLWSLRKAPPKGNIGAPSDYSSLHEILPGGFLDRTNHLGRVVSWVPQVAVLAHSSIGGFVSHCGWNSTLESIWFGVPIATWPLYADQQLIAFCLLKEYGLAEEIMMDYRRNYKGDKKGLITADKIERGIKRVMGMDNGKMMKVKEVSELSKKVMEEGGSSYGSLGKFIEDVFKNMP